MPQGRDTGRGTTGMVTASIKQRVALAGFDDGPQICRAVLELGEADITVDDFGVVARASSILALRFGSASCRPGGRLGAVLDGEMEAVRVASGVNDAVVVSAGSFWKKLGCFSDSTEQDLISATWIAPHLRDELTASLCRGAIILGLCARTLGQHWRATRILLQFSSSKVQTYEILVPA